MKSSRLEKDKRIEDNIIKDVRNLFRLEKEIDYTTVKDIRNLFRLRKGNEAIKGFRNSYRYQEPFLSMKKKLKLL